MTLGSADSVTATNRAGTQIGEFDMGDGTLNVGTLHIGQITAAGSISGSDWFRGIGRFYLYSASGTLNATTINLATNPTTANASVNGYAYGTIYLVNGTLVATTIQEGAQTGNAGTAVASFQWTPSRHP